MTRNRRSSQKSNNKKSKAEAEDYDIVSEPFGQSEQGDTRTIMLFGEIDTRLAQTVIEKLFMLSEQDSVSPIYLVINTPGGYVVDAFCIYDAIKFIKAPVHTIGLGAIESAGVQILAAGKKGHRMIGKNARILHHLHFDEKFGGNVFEQKNYAKEAERMAEQRDICLANDCNKPLNEVKMWLKDRLDKFIMPEEAIELGIVDKILE
jgi:ATP-dependent Clp protease protease subunit